MAKKKKGKQILSIGLRSQGLNSCSQAQEDLSDPDFLEDDEDIMGSTGPKGEKMKKSMEDIIRSKDFLIKSHKSPSNSLLEGFQAWNLEINGANSSSRASWAEEVELEVISSFPQLAPNSNRKTTSFSGSEPVFSKKISVSYTVSLPDKDKTVEIGNSNLDAKNSFEPKESVKQADNETEQIVKPFLEEVPTVPKKTFASLFSDNRKLSNGLSLKFMPSSELNTVSFTSDEWKEGEVLWSNALIGHVIGLNVKFKSMESYISKLWSKFSIPKISLIKHVLDPRGGVIRVLC